MGSPHTIDIDLILNPIAGSLSGGQDIRYAGPYDAIKEARRADLALPQGHWERPVKSADWPTVIKISTEVLTTRSKDLQVAAWLTEGLLKRHGFAGFRDGVTIMRGLHERFWETMYPSVVDGDMDYRSGPLVWVEKELPAALKKVPLTKSGKGEFYSYLHWEESRDIDNQSRKDSAAASRALAEGKITGEAFDKAMVSTPLNHIQLLRDDLEDALRELDALGQLIDSEYGTDPPSLRMLKEAAAQCETLLAEHIKKKGGKTAVPATAAGTPVLSHTAHPTSAEVVMTTQPSAGLEPADRADALRRLLAIADFFHRTEPHTPISYLIERAARWGAMPFEQWLKEVVGDAAVLAHIRETLGLREPSAEESES